MRILPHHQDTGGFFVAVLQKKKLCPWESVRKSGEDGTDETTSENGKNGKLDCFIKKEKNIAHLKWTIGGSHSSKY